MGISKHEFYFTDKPDVDAFLGCVRRDLPVSADVEAQVEEDDLRLALRLLSGHPTEMERFLGSQERLMSMGRLSEEFRLVHSSPDCLDHVFVPIATLSRESWMISCNGKGYGWANLVQMFDVADKMMPILSDYYRIYFAGMGMERNFDAQSAMRDEINATLDLSVLGAANGWMLEHVDSASMVTHHCIIAEMKSFNFMSVQTSIFRNLTEMASRRWK